MCPKAKKRVLVLATSMPMTMTREETVETAKTIETADIDKDGKQSKVEYPKNLA